MEFLIFILIALCLVLGLAFWARVKKERLLVKGLFDLSDKQKHYLAIILEKSRLEVYEQVESDKDALSSLYDLGWIFRFNDGVYVADSKLECLASRLNN